MALKSMTGFGRGQTTRKGVTVEVEIGSVNRRQFDARVNMPRAYAVLEPEVQGLVRRAITRGHISINVQFSMSGDARRRCVSLDMEMAREWTRRLKSVASELDLSYDVGIRDVVQMPEVVQVESFPDDARHVWPLIRRATTDALGALMAMKEREGAALEADLQRRFKRLRALTTRVHKRAPQVPARHAKNLQSRLAKAGLSIDTDSEQLLRELAIFADRSDISEELTRLASHFQQADKLMAGRQPAGRALDFLCQEMLREMNTIASKGNDTQIARLVIRLKAELERVREQVQNVE